MPKCLGGETAEIINQMENDLFFWNVRPLHRSRADLFRLNFFDIGSIEIVNIQGFKRDTVCVYFTAEMSNTLRTGTNSMTVTFG